MVCLKIVSPALVEVLKIFERVSHTFLNKTPVSLEDLSPEGPVKEFHKFGSILGHPIVFTFYLTYVCACLSVCVCVCVRAYNISI